MKALRKLLTAALATALPLSALAQPAPTEQPPVSETRPTPPAETPPPVAPAPKPAAAPTPLVTIYGTLNVNMQYTEASDASATFPETVVGGVRAIRETAGVDVSPRTAISSDSSNIGFRGALDIGRGLKAVYQCETSAALDVGNATFCGRNSRVGLSGDWGTLFYGNWDTPFKAGTYGTKADDPFGNTDVFGFQGIMSSPGFNARSGGWSGAATHSFDLRAQNSVAYWTPKFSGLSAKFQYGTNETRTADGLVDPALYSAVINYDMGGLSLVAAGEYHEDAFGIRSMSQNAVFGGTATEIFPVGSTTRRELRTTRNNQDRASKDMAWRVAAGYELPVAGGAFTVMGMFEQLLYQQDNALRGFTDYDRLAWLVGAKFRTGAHEFRARYSQALDPNIDAAADTTSDLNASEDDLAAMQYAVGYAYHLAKSTQVFAFYTQILNDDRAQYTLTIGGSPAVAGSTPAGADPMAVGLGIRHAF